LLVSARNKFWNIVVYSFDVLLCGLVMYYSGPFSDPPFGVGSPFYRYAFSAIIAAAFMYRYTGGLLAAACIDMFVLLGLFVHAPGWHTYVAHTPIDIGGSLIDAPLLAILVAYVSSLLESYTQSKMRERENVRTQKYLVRVGETLLKSARDRQELLQSSLLPLQKGWHFGRIMIALIDTSEIVTGEAGQGAQHHAHAEIVSCVESTMDDSLPASSRIYIEQVLRSGQTLTLFDVSQQGTAMRYGIARLYLPLRRAGHIQIVLGVESKRSIPFGSQQESFLTIAGAQLLVALENIRLAEQTIELAERAERGRIAREIHDGIAQLTYMLSLQAETAHVQAQHIAADSPDATVIAPLAERLEKLVLVSKQALWESRNYMFSLKPLMHGTMVLAQMLQSQLNEFTAISNITTQFVVEGADDRAARGAQVWAHEAQIGTALFRIMQEALMNAYKHAEATNIIVTLRYTSEQIEVEICDDGKGMTSAGVEATEDAQHMLSGYGMRGMYERAQELGGVLTISPGCPNGVVVHACIPYSSAGR